MKALFQGKLRWYHGAIRPLDERSFFISADRGGEDMFGRLGIVIIVIAAFVCTGVLTDSENFALQMDMSFIPGLIIMAAAVVFACSAPAILRKLPEEKRQQAEVIIKLSSVVLCAAGALMVFCG